MRIARSIPFPTVIPVIGALFLTAVALFAMYRFGNYGFLFLPVGLLAIPIWGRRLLDDPIPVFCIFLLIVVNLDFFKLGGLVTLDILVSSILLWGVILRLGLDNRRLFGSAVEKAFLIFLAVTLLSVIASVNPLRSFKNWMRDVEYLVFFSFIFLFPLTQKGRRSIVLAVIVSSLIPCVLGLVGMAFKISALYGAITPVAGGESVERINSTLTHPVVFSHYLAFVGTMTLSVIIHGRWFRRTYLIPLFALQMVVLYLTFGRTGWIEFVAAGIVLLWLYGRRRIVILGIPVMLVGLLQAIPTMLARFQNVFEVEAGGQNSLIWRLGLWAYALSLFPNRPILGSGPDTFIEYVSYMTGFAAHQTWIGLLIETGIVGLFAFAALVFVLARALRKKLKSMGGENDPLIIGMNAAVIGALVGSLAGDPFGLPAVSLYLWTLTALALSTPVPRQSEPGLST